MWPFVILCIYALTTSVFAHYPVEGLVWSLKVLYLVTIFMASYILAVKGFINNKTLWKLAALVLLIYFISQLTASMTGHGGLSGYKTEYGTAGFGEQVSTLSWAICGLIPCFILSRKWRFVDVMMIFIAFTSIFLTMRRTGFLAILIVIIFIMILRLFRRRTGGFGKIISLLVPTIMITSAWYVLNNTEIGYVFMGRLEDLYTPEGTASGRYIIQKIGLEHLLNRGTFATIFGEGAAFSKILLGEKMSVWIGMHSDWLDIAIAYGLIGIVCFALFYLGIFRILINAYKKSDENIDALIGVFLVMSFGAVASGGILNTNFAMPYAVLGLIKTKNN